MAAGPSAGVGNGILKFGQIDNVPSSKTKYDWIIERFDVEFYPIHYEPDDPDDDFNYVEEFRPSHTLRKKLVSKKFLAGEVAGFKSSWHVELDLVCIQRIAGDHWEFEASLVFEEYLGDKKSWKPFRCHAKMSTIEPKPFRHIVNFKPELHAVTVTAVNQRIAFKYGGGGGAMYEEKNGVIVVSPTICLSVELEIFGENYSAPYDVPRDEEYFRSIPSIQLQQDLGNLLNCKESSDFTIKCDGKDFSVHKTILWGRSKVFARMFSIPGFKECRENMMVVTDIAQDTMEILLQYIYTGKLSELMNSDNLEGVIRGADKYGLTELKEYCFLKLVGSVSEDNFGSLAYFASCYHAGEEVLAVLKRFYERNVFKLLKNAEFRRLAAEHPEVVFEN